MSRTLVALVLVCTAPFTAAAVDVEAARLAIRTKQFEQAVKLLEKDVRQGSTEAQYLLGLAFWNGVGVSPDRDVARGSLRQAALAGHAAAAHALAALLAGGTPAERAEAPAWISRAADGGYAPAIALRDAHGLPLDDARTAAGRASDLRIEIARVAARNDDLPLLEAVGPAELTTRRDVFGRTLLFDAAAAGASAVTQRLLAAGAAIDVADEYGVTPLMLAAERADAAITRLLLGAGARVDAADRAGRTALFRAAAANRAEQIVALRSAGAAIDHPDLRGWTAFDLALQRNAPAALEALRAAGAHATQIAPVLRGAAGIDTSRPGLLYRGWPPLSIAAARDQAGEVRRRVAEGADLQSVTPHGAAPLQVAVESRSREAFRALLELGADPRRKALDGVDAIERVVRAGDTSMFAALLAAGVRINERDGAQLLAAAVSRSDAAMTRALLASGVPAAATDGSGKTALMHAARVADLDLVKLLLDRGAAVDDIDGEGRSALWYASAAGSGPVVKVLLAVRAEPDGADREGNGHRETPLLAAIRAGSPPAVMQLLEAGAAVDSRGGDSESPLRIAAGAGQARIVALLLERRPQLDAVDAFGDTALMAAARKGDLDVCVRLLGAGANPRLRNRERATAADLAEARGFAALAQRLRS